MQFHFNSFSLRGTIAASALAASLFFVGAATVRADDDCQKRVDKADKNLHEAAAKHGWDSPEAAKYREELNQARSYCWEHNHRWWSADDHRWHTERDWDDHDHDHAPMDHPQK
jgi:hypothetical protein